MKTLGLLFFMVATTSICNAQWLQYYTTDYASTRFSAITVVNSPNAGRNLIVCGTVSGGENPPGIILLTIRPMDGGVTSKNIIILDQDMLKGPPSVTSIVYKDSFLMVCGFVSTSGNKDAFVMRYDLYGGSVVWVKAYTSMYPIHQTIFNNIISVNNLDFLIVGREFTSIGSSRDIFCDVDIYGNLVEISKSTANWLRNSYAAVEETPTGICLLGTSKYDVLGGGYDGEELERPTLRICDNHGQHCSDHFYLSDLDTASCLHLTDENDYDEDSVDILLATCFGDLFYSNNSYTPDSSGPTPFPDSLHRNPFEDLVLMEIDSSGELEKAIKYDIVGNDHEDYDGKLLGVGTQFNIRPKGYLCLGNVYDHHFSDYLGDVFLFRVDVTTDTIIWSYKYPMRLYESDLPDWRSDAYFIDTNRDYERSAYIVGQEIDSSINGIPSLDGAIMRIGIEDGLLAQTGCQDSLQVNVIYLHPADFEFQFQELSVDSPGIDIATDVFEPHLDIECDACSSHYIWCGGEKSMNEETEMKEMVTVFPNPFSTQTIFYFNNNSQEKNIYTIEIRNEIGVLIEKINNIQNSEYVYKCNSSSGIYFYRVLENGNFLNSGSLVKM